MGECAALQKTVPIDTGGRAFSQPAFFSLLSPSEVQPGIVSWTRCSGFASSNPQLKITHLHSEVNLC